jgi:hypothetical protein
LQESWQHVHMIPSDKIGNVSLFDSLWCYKVQWRDPENGESIFGLFTLVIAENNQKRYQKSTGITLIYKRRTRYIQSVPIGSCLYHRINQGWSAISVHLEFFITQGFYNTWPLYSFLPNNGVVSLSSISPWSRFPEERLGIYHTKLISRRTSVSAGIVVDFTALRLARWILLLAYVVRRPSFLRNSTLYYRSAINMIRRLQNTLSNLLLTHTESR